jgi:hypothetical protein
MATRRIPEDQVVLNISNTTTQPVEVGGVKIPVGATRAIAGRHVLGSDERAQDLATMITAGSVSVVYSVPSLNYSSAVTAEWAASFSAPISLPAGMMPVYTTAGRPASAATGYAIFNSTTGIPNYWDGSAWVDASGAPA